MGWADPAPEPVPGQPQVHSFNYFYNVQRGKQMESLIMKLLSLLFSNRKKCFLGLCQPFLSNPLPCLKSGPHVQYLNNMSHGQNLSSTSGQPEIVAQKFFEIPASEFRVRLNIGTGRRFKKYCFLLLSVSFLDPCLCRCTPVCSFRPRLEQS